MNKIRLHFAMLLSISCAQSSTSNEEISSSLAENLLVQSISYTKFQDSQSSNFIDNYYYEGSKIESRTETNLDTGNVQTYEYTYTNNLISSVHRFRADGDLESEFNINYDSSQRVASYNLVSYSDDTSSTYWQAVFLYDNDKLLHCDGQTWSSVEYKDIYESVHLYTINGNGDFVHMNRVEDCSFSAMSTTSSYEVFAEYDDKPSPFSNIKGNNFVISSILGVFTNSAVNGLYNNSTKQSAVLDDAEEIQTWVIEYNEFNHPQSMSWKREESTQENINIIYY